MKKIVIYEDQRGFLFKNGKFIKMLTAGSYRYLGKAYNIVVMSAIGQFDDSKIKIKTILSDPKAAAELDVLTVSDNEYAFRYIDGRFYGIFDSGEYAFWNVYGKNTFVFMNAAEPRLDMENRKFSSSSLMFDDKIMQVYVPNFNKAIIYYDGKFNCMLDEGLYYFKKGGVNVTYSCVDTRIIQLDITGQEMLTLDKVTLRVNFVFRYRLTDYTRIFEQYSNFDEQLRSAVQLALRDYIGKNPLDKLLENKDGIAKYVVDVMTERAKDFFIEVIDAGAKDIILPGEIRDIMNTVLVAEKKAQANVITRREEVASTRSLLNTAKLMEENPTLCKLKEMEYIERICDNVGNISVSGGGNILEELSKMIGGK